MSLLSEVVGTAKQAVQNEKTRVVNEATAGVRGVIANAKNDVTNTIRGTVSGAVNAGIKGVTGAAVEALRGDLGAAASSLLSTPGSIVDSITRSAQGFLGNAGSLITGQSLGGGAGVAVGDSLNGARARPDPLLSFLWYGILPDITPPSQQSTFGAALGGTATKAFQAAAGDSVFGNISAGFAGAAVGAAANSFANKAMTYSLPWYYVEGANTPFRSYEQTTIFREGRDRKYPSKYNVDDLSLSIYLDSAGEAMKYLQAWDSRIMAGFTPGSAATDGGGFGRPVNYKKPIRIVLLSVALQELIVLEYTECWPTNIASLDLNSDTSNRLTAEVNFSVGDVFVNVLPISSTAINGILGNIGGFGNSVNGAISSIAGAATNAVRGAVGRFLS